MRLTSQRLVPVLGALVLLLAWGCATGSQWRWSGAGERQYSDSLSRGIVALESGDYADARSPLHWLAARCEAGFNGRQAMLLLAAVALDPRNPEASADEGARLAARFLGLPGSDPGERVVAETLYLLAVDRGGEIPADPESPAEGAEEGGQAGQDAGGAAARTGVPAIARRFHACGDPAPPAEPRGAALPDLPGTPTAELFTRVRAARDSLQGRLSELEAELERIRELLQGGVPPDTGGLHR